MTHPDIIAIKEAGFICIRLTPLMWRARGDGMTELYVEVWPFQKLSSFDGGKPSPYTDAVAAVKKWLIPYPPITGVGAALEAHKEWQRGLRDLYRKLSTAGAVGPLAE